MKVGRFRTAQEIVVGPGSFEHFGEVVARRGKVCLLVTGSRAAHANGWIDRATEMLTSCGVKAVLFDKVNGEPTLDIVDQGRAVAKEAGSDVVAAIGGGSALDAGKSIAGLLAHDEPTAEFFYGKSITASAAPFIAVATTSGTGSEVTPNAVLIDPKNKKKASIRGDGLMPVAAIVDSDLTVSLPRKQTIYSGMDALTQAIESATSIHATELTKALSYRATKLILNALPTAVENGEDRKARHDMAYGSLLAGMALANARLGVVHGLAHPLGVRYDIPHGLICGVLLPHAVKWNIEKAPEPYEELNREVGEDCLAHVIDLRDRFELPRSLDVFGVRVGDLNVIVEESMPSGSLKANPRKVVADELKTFLEGICRQ